MQRKRFCLIATFFPPFHFGGDAIVTATLANALVDAGHEVDVIHSATAYEVLAKGRPPSGFGVDPRVRVHTLRSPMGSLGPVLTYLTGGPALHRQAIARILDQPFDVIHFHNPSLITGPEGFQMGNALRLCTLHEFWLLCPTHHLFKYGEEVCHEKDCLQCTVRSGRPPQPWRYTGLVNRSVPGVDAFIAPTRFVAKMYAESPLALQPAVIANPFTPAPPQPKGAGDYYFFAGRLETAKGLQTILPLFRDGRRRLVVAGDGPLRADLERLAQGCAVEFRGRVAHQDLPGLYAQARATIVCSISYETFGLTVLESLSQATPVVVSDCGGPPEIVQELGGGFVYRNLEQLETLLARLDADDHLARGLGERGQAGVTRYSPSQHLEAYLGLIESLSQRKVRGALTGG